MKIKREENTMFECLSKDTQETDPTVASGENSGSGCEDNSFFTECPLYHLNCLPYKPATFKQYFHGMAPQCPLVCLLPFGWKAAQNPGITIESAIIYSESTQQDFEGPPFARPCELWH